MVQVSLERLSSGLREAIVRPRNPTVERLSYLDVTSFLQPPSVNTEVPVGGVETLLEFVEGERFLHHECAYDPKADTPVDNPVERCSPPNPTAIERSPAAGITRSENAPTTMKHIPITGTILTEKVPAVTTAAP